MKDTDLARKEPGNEWNAFGDLVQLDAVDQIKALHMHGEGTSLVRSTRYLLSRGLLMMKVNDVLNQQSALLLVRQTVSHRMKERIGEENLEAFVRSVVLEDEAIGEEGPERLLIPGLRTMVEKQWVDAPTEASLEWQMVMLLGLPQRFMTELQESRTPWIEELKTRGVVK